MMLVVERKKNTKRTSLLASLVDDDRWVSALNEESTAIMAGENEIEKRNFCAREREGNREQGFNETRTTVKWCVRYHGRELRDGSRCDRAGILDTL